jgi:putative addiction module killer protein
MVFEVIKTDIFDKWLRKLKNSQSRRKITDHVYRMTYGNLGNTRNVGDGIFEKKINYAGGYRLYYFFKTQNQIIILCGGDKSTQQNDINQAKKIKTCLLADRKA